MILKIRFHRPVRDGPTCANSSWPTGRAGCVMIPSCKILVLWGYDWTLFSRPIETVDLESVHDKNTAHPRRRIRQLAAWPFRGTPQHCVSVTQPRESQSF